MPRKVMTLDQVHAELKKHPGTTPTKLGPHLGLTQAVASGRLSPKLLKLVAEGRAKREGNGVYTAL